MRYLKVLAILIIIIGVFAFLANFVFTSKKLKVEGVVLKPLISPLEYNVSFFSQDSSLWANDKLGETDFTLGSSGCLVSSLASCLTFYGDSINPQQLNNLFSKNDVYNGNGEIVWYKMMPLFPNIQYTPPFNFNSQVISKDLKDGILPIVKVKFNKNGYWHWVLIIGCNKDEFIIFDPLNPNKRNYTLKNHGKVYAYRKLSKILAY